MKKGSAIRDVIKVIILWLLVFGLVYLIILKSGVLEHFLTI